MTGPFSEWLREELDGCMVNQGLCYTDTDAQGDSRMVPIFEVDVSMSDPVLVIPDEDDIDEEELRSNKFEMHTKLRMLGRLAPGERLKRVARKLLGDKWKPFLRLCSETHGEDFSRINWGDLPKESMVQLVALAMSGELSGTSLSVTFSPGAFFSEMFDARFTPQLKKVVPPPLRELLRRTWSESNLWLCQDLLLVHEEEEPREVFLRRCIATARMVACAIRSALGEWDSISQDMILVDTGTLDSWLKEE